MGPLLTLSVLEGFRAAVRAGSQRVECSLDLQRSIQVVDLQATSWVWNGSRFPYPKICKDRTIYHWGGARFEPVARYSTSLIKLVPTAWGPPTFEIDGIKMLPTAHISPYEDAQHKVALIRPRGKVILDTCAGLGYFAAWCLRGQAAQILSYEKHADVLWLRSLNPWSPAACARLTLTQGDIAEQLPQLSERSVDAILHDPPRFGIAGELYSQVFYGHLARVIRRRGLLFHYTGSPNKLAGKRDLPNEVANRLRYAGFAAEPHGDGVLAVKK